MGVELGAGVGKGKSELVANATSVFCPGQRQAGVGVGLGAGVGKGKNALVSH